MNCKTKREIVERLKKNERAYCFLSDEEKEVLGAISVNNLRRLISCGAFSGYGSFEFGSFEFGNAMTYRIAESYTIPIEPPEGYRLVTDEERDENNIPLNNVAMYVDINDGYCWNIAHSIDVTGWSDDKRADFLFAVPIDFKFEETISIDGEDFTLSQIKSALKKAKGTYE